MVIRHQVGEVRVGSLQDHLHLVVPLSRDLGNLRNNTLGSLLSVFTEMMLN